MSVFAGVLLALAPWAQSSQDGWFEKASVGVTAESPWPAKVTGGYVPVFVEVRNEGDRARAVKLTLVGQGTYGNRIARNLRLEPGEVREVELIAPIAGSSWGRYFYNLEAEVEGQVEKLSATNVDASNALVRSVVFLTDDSSRKDELPDLQDFERTNGNELYSQRLVPFDRAPRRFEPWTGLHLVVVDASAPGLTEELLDPVLAWARTGGIVVFYGVDAVEVADGIAGVRPWLEDRFLLRENRSARLHAFGVGLVGTTTRAGAMFAIDGLLGEVWGNGTPDGITVPSPRSRSFAGVAGLEQLPYRGLVLLLIVFAFLIGPVNFLFVKNTGKPGLLLVTIPLIALLVSAGIITFGIVRQGLDVKVSSFTFSVLDQRSHQASTYQARSFFCGLVPGQGLRPGPRTACFPVTDGSFRNGPSYQVDFGESLRLAGGFLPARRVANQNVVHERAARGRVLFRREGEALLAENVLGARIERLALRGADGELWVSAGAIDSGATATLEPVSSNRSVREFHELLAGEESEAEEEEEVQEYDIFGLPIQKEERTSASGAQERFVSRFHAANLDELWPSSYLAIVASNPFTEDFGLEANHAGGFHVIQGILAPGEEEGR